MDNWFGLLKEQIEAKGGTPITAETYAELKVMWKTYICHTFELIYMGWGDG